jgi:segregation and condensation protein A
LSLTITLPVFEGPLDLLLYLVEKQELDIYRVDVASVAHQYVAHLRALEQLDLELASEFFVMAVRLLSLKARALLPSPQAETTQDAGFVLEDPRDTLIRELMDYRRCRERSKSLEALAAEQGRRFARAPAGLGGSLALPDEEEVLPPSLLLQSYCAVRARLAGRLRVIPAEVLTVRRRMVELLFRLRSKGTEVFAAVCGAQTSRREFVVTVLALLELLRRRRVTAVQQSPFGDILVGIRRIQPRIAADGQQAVH